MSDLIRLASLGLDRRTARVLDRLSSEANHNRAIDRVRAALTAGRISDLAGVTRHGIKAGTSIAMEAELEASGVASEVFQRELVYIATAGTRGIARQIDALADNS